MNTENNNGLLGTWCEQSETLSTVEYTVSKSESGFMVAAKDTYDSESGEVSQVQWHPDKAELSFSCYWASSGRYCKCRFTLISENKVEFTYTYTDHEILVRKNA